MSYETIRERVRQILREESETNEGRPQAAKDKPSYYKGLSNSTAAKRAAHFKKQSKMASDDPRAYKPAPGDARAKTKPSKWNPKNESENIDEMLGNPPGGNFTGEGVEEADMDESGFNYAAAKAAMAGKKTFKFGGKEHPVKMSKDKAEKILDEIEKIEEALALAAEILEESEMLEEKMSKKTRTALKNKAEKSNAPLGALTQVYNKGLAAWRTGHRPGASQHAWAMGRVNSFLRGGPARKVDSTQWKKVQKHRKKK
jgi:hypothetical protein